MLSPFTPHICEEMWNHTGHEGSAYLEKWPKFDESALIKDSVEIVVQLNGKVKEKIEIATGLSKEAFTDAVMENEKVQALLKEKEIIKVIAVPGKLLNIVAK
jgi:leucyl-tRNA synthetase